MILTTVATSALLARASPRPCRLALLLLVVSAAAASIPSVESIHPNELFRAVSALKMHRKFRPYSFHMRLLRGSRTSPMAGGGGGGGGGDEGGGDGGKGKEVPAYVKFTEKLLLTAANEEGPMTILIPLDVTEYYTSIKDYSAEEREKIMKYHMIPKQYKYKKLMKEKAGYKIKTKVDGQKISKMTGDKFPGIVLMGKKGMPSIMVGGDVFVGEELAIHLVTSMLFPKFN